MTGWDVDQYAARDLLEAVPVGVTIHDPSRPDAPIRYANDRFCSLTGQDREAVAGASLDLLVGPTTDERRLRSVVDPLDAPATAVVETARADGSTFPNWLRATPLADGHTLLAHDDISAGGDREWHPGDTGVPRAADWPGTLAESPQDGAAGGALASVDLGAVSEACWRTVATDRAELSVQTDRRIRADPRRLAQLLSALFRNAVEHGDAWQVTLGELGGGFYVGDDGSGIPEAERAALVDTGLSTCRQVARFHGWELDVGETVQGGARVDVSGVELVR